MEDLEYEDNLSQNFANLKSLLAKEQKNGNLPKELNLCKKLATVALYLQDFRSALEFGTSSLQIAEDLADSLSTIKAVSELIKLFIKMGQVERAEEYLSERLLGGGGGGYLNQELKRKAKRILFREAGEIFLLLGSTKVHALAREDFLKGIDYSQNALLMIQEAIDQSQLQDITEDSIDQDKSREFYENKNYLVECAILLGKLHQQIDENHYQARAAFMECLKLGTDSTLLKLRCHSVFGIFLTDAKHYREALDQFIRVVDLYKSDEANKNFKDRRTIYCTVLYYAGIALTELKDYDFAITNLLLSLEECKIVLSEPELVKRIKAQYGLALQKKETAESLHTLPPLSLKRADKLIFCGDYDEAIEILKYLLDQPENTDNTEVLLKLAKLHVNKDLLREAELFYERGLGRGKRNIEWICQVVEMAKSFRTLPSKISHDFLLYAYDQINQLKIPLDLQLEICSELALIYKDTPGTYEKFKLECINLTAILSLKRKDKGFDDYFHDCENFSYFANRKPSKSMLGLIGRDMMMRTKVKRAAKGLDLSRLRGPRIVKVVSSEKISKKRTCNVRCSQEHKVHKRTVFSVISSPDVKFQSDSEVQSDVEFQELETESDHKEHRVEQNLHNSTPSLFCTSDKSVPKFTSLGSGALNSSFLKINVKMDGKTFIVPFKSEKTVASLLEEIAWRYKTLNPNNPNVAIKSASIASNNSLLFPSDQVGAVLTDLETIQIEALSQDFLKVATLHELPIRDEIHNLIERWLKSPPLYLPNSKEHCEHQQFISRLIFKLKSFEEAMERKENLVKLDLSFMGINGMKLLNEVGACLNVIMNCNALVELSLQSNFLTEYDFGESKLPKTLTSLDLSGNLISQCDVLNFPETIEILSLGYNPLSFDSFPRFIQKFKNLKQLDLRCCYNLITNSTEMDEFLEIVGGIQRLEKLYINVDNRLQSEFIYKISRIPVLRLSELGLIGEEWVEKKILFEPLSSISSLKRLDLSNSSNFKGRSKVLKSLCNLLVQSMSLKVLVLRGSDLDDEGFRELIECGLAKNYSVEEMDVARCEGIRGTTMVRDERVKKIQIKRT